MASRYQRIVAWFRGQTHIYIYIYIYIDILLKTVGYGTDYRILSAPPILVPLGVPTIVFLNN